MRPLSVRCSGCPTEIPVALHGRIPSLCQDCKVAKARHIRELGDEPELFTRVRRELGAA